MVGVNSVCEFFVSQRQVVSKDGYGILQISSLGSPRSSWTPSSIVHPSRMMACPMKFGRGQSRCRYLRQSLPLRKMGSATKPSFPLSGGDCLFEQATWVLEVFFGRKAFFCNGFQHNGRGFTGHTALVLGLRLREDVGDTVTRAATRINRREHSTFWDVAVACGLNECSPPLQCLSCRYSVGERRRRKRRKERRRTSKYHGDCLDLCMRTRV